MYYLISILFGLIPEVLYFTLFITYTNQNGDEIFGYEDVCELVALSNGSINRIVNLYLEEKGF